ncbi:Isochorismate synthase MenF [Neolewinella maritima]|uniref:Isochorismate synthase MenF n=1 Tax=Neolewinella maritima TaxID=1383882 RepID=A0ABM9B031_9BACT|nr:aminodeoxychorismate synthase component I [Neolewinella maritima]CAH1000446.1 Isochorismate synthase MenF [Neolewinella maritima]
MRELYSVALSDWAERVNAAAVAAQPFFFLLDFELLEPRLYTESEWREQQLVSFAFPGGEGGVRAQRDAVSLTAHPIPTRRYREAFDLVQSGLQRGDSFLTNLTFATPIDLQGSLEAVYGNVSAKYRVWLPERFVAFSPETFITIDAAGFIRTSPMKGTALDTPAARSELVNDPKEVAEHATIVDLLRNDLSQVARGVRVSAYRYLRALETHEGGLVQTSSDIGANLPEEWREQLGYTLLRLLPAGSVSGAPKPATLDLIRRAEGEQRGYYCGIAGYYDGRALDTCVLIRFIEQRDQAYYFRSGGGITARSNWASEYAELNAKIRLPA